MTTNLSSVNRSPYFDTRKKETLRKLIIANSSTASSASTGTYTPTFSSELNASGTITVIDPFAYIQVGNTVFVQFNVSIDSNAAGGDYQVEAGFDLPVATTDYSTISGSATCTDAADDAVVFAGSIEGRAGSTSAVVKPIINTYYPTGTGIAKFKGTFSYQVVA